MSEGPTEPSESMEDVIRRDGRYPPEAFALLQDAMARAVKEKYGDRGGESRQKHVTGSQLCLALRDLAMQRWGMLAATVLGRWNIRGTRDFGNMVFLLVEHGYMRKRPQDTIEDFDEVFDFQQAFERDYAFGSDE